MPSSTVSSVNAVSRRALADDRRVGEVEVGPDHGRITHRETPPIGLEPSARRDREVRLVDQGGSGREVRMEPDAERRRRGRTVRRHRGDLEAIGRHPVLHLEVDPPREGGLLGHARTRGSPRRPIARPDATPAIGRDRGSRSSAPVRPALRPLGAPRTRRCRPRGGWATAPAPVHGPPRTSRRSRTHRARRGHRPGMSGGSLPPPRSRRRGRPPGSRTAPRSAAREPAGER